MMKDNLSKQNNSKTKSNAITGIINLLLKYRDITMEVGKDTVTFRCGNIRVVEPLSMVQSSEHLERLEKQFILISSRTKSEQNTYDNETSVSVEKQHKQAPFINIENATNEDLGVAFKVEIPRFEKETFINKLMRTV